MRGRRWGVHAAGTLPTISNILAHDVTDSSFGVSFDVAPETQGQVEYGTTTAYGSLSDVSTAFASSHDITISGLSTGTYHYRVLAIGHDGTQRSADATVAIAPLNGPLITSVNVHAIGSTSVEVEWSVTPGSTGQVLWGTTTALGSQTTLETSYLTYHNQTVPSSGSLSASTTYYYQVVSTDSNGATSTSAIDSFTTAASATATRFGPGYSSNTLSNTTVGDPTNSRGNPLSMRFRAGQTGTITSVSVWTMNQGGYGAGSPTASIEFQGDDGSSSHFPDGVALAASTDIGTIARVANSPIYNQYTLASGVPVVAGTLYHCLFYNTHTDPYNNWYSLDGHMANYGSGSVQFGGRWNPMLPDTDWQVLYLDTAGWVNRTAHWPILDLGFADGHHEGLSYMEVSYSGLSRYYDWPQRINGAVYSRQRFVVPAGGLSITGAGVRLTKYSGSTAALTVELQDSSRVAYGSFTLAAATFPDTSRGSGDGVDSPNWGAGTFSGAPHSLSAGATVFLELRTTSASTFRAMGIRKAYPGYDSATYPAGYAEASNDSGSSWSAGTALWGGGITQLSDIQCYLELA